MTAISITDTIIKKCSVIIGINTRRAGRTGKHGGAGGEGSTLSSVFIYILSVPPFGLQHTVVYVFLIKICKCLTG